MTEKVEGNLDRSVIGVRYCVVAFAGVREGSE